MILFFGTSDTSIFAVQTNKKLTSEDLQKLTWLFGNQAQIDQPTIDRFFVGPRAAMITPWSTNAVEITQNMAITGIQRIEKFKWVAEGDSDYDPMLLQKYKALNQEIFTIEIEPEAILDIEDIAGYNQQEGLALSTQEIDYLEGISKKIGRKLTDS